MDISKLKSAELCDAETMLARLIETDSEPHFRERFYPRLTALAGRRLNGVGVIIALQLEIAEYTRGMPPLMGRLMDMRIGDFVDAIMPDEEVAKDAKAFHAEVLAA